MRSVCRNSFIGSVAALAALAFAGPGLAQPAGYPDHAIQTIVGFPPGTGADIIVRFFSNKLSEISGQPVIVVNKGGAFGNIATETVMHSAPDGYTIGIAPASSTMAAVTHLFKKLPFDPVKDFAPVATIAKVPFVLGISANSKIGNVQELIAALKQKGDKVSFGTAASTSVATAELFKQLTGTKGLNVTYKGPADIAQGLRADELDYSFFDASSALDHQRGGRIKLLAVTSAQRSSTMPDIPTLIESGVKDFDVDAWWAVYVVAGTPKPIIDKLNGWLMQILKQDDTRAFLARFGAEPMPGSPEDFARLLAAQTTRWGELIKLANIQPQ